MKKTRMAKPVIVVARVTARTAGMNTSSLTMRTLLGPSRSTARPAAADPISEATPSAAITQASSVGVALNSNDAFPQIPTKKAASPPVRETKRARATWLTSESLMMTRYQRQGFAGKSLRFHREVLCWSLASAPRRRCHHRP